MNAILELSEAQFRPMRIDDLPRIMYIEERAYKHPWTLGIFRSCLKVNYPCWLVEQDSRVIGYGAIMVQVGECHILNVTVDPEYQGQGLGRKLLNHFLQLGIKHGATTAFLEVRVSNSKAISLYESEGFHRIGERKDYYPDDEGREDAYVFAKELLIELEPS